MTFQTSSFLFMACFVETNETRETTETTETRETRVSLKFSKSVIAERHTFATGIIIRHQSGR